MSMRQSGRTTTMLKAAEAGQEFGHVLIIVPNRGIEQHCRSLAAKHGIQFFRTDFTTIEPLLRGKYRGFSGEVYEDHTCWEMPAARVREDLANELLLMRSINATAKPVDPFAVEEEERQQLREALRQSQAPSN